MTIIKKRKGNTTIELMMVMILLILFGLTIYELISAGSMAQAKIVSEKDDQIDARIALSFVNVRIRQNDISGKIEVKKYSPTDKNSIVIKERKEEANYDTWIYFANGKLLECIVEPDQQPDENLSSLICEAEDFNINFDYENRTFTNSIHYKYGENNNKTLQSIISLRSDK